MDSPTPTRLDDAAPGLALALQQTLPRLPRTLPETHFDSLRRAALHQAQDLAGQRWTDYNLHDPGVTLLEAFCYALTELGYRADAPVADQLADTHNRIDWPAHGLLPPAEALPCRPSTGADLQRWLLDQVPGLAGVLLQPTADDSATPGVLNLLLEPAEGADADALPGRVRQVAAGGRNLGQDLGQVRVLRRRPCRLLGALRIEGGRDPAEIVADVHQRCAAWLAAGVHFDTHEQALAGGAALDEVLEGPPTQHAAAQTWRLATHRPDTVFIADLVRCARETPGVADVAWLALQPEGGAPAHASLRARDLQAGWTLALVLPAGHDAGTGVGADGGDGVGTDVDVSATSAAPGGEGIWPARVSAGLSLHRRGNAVELSWPAVRHFDAELRATRLAQGPTSGPRVRPGYPPARPMDPTRRAAPPGLPPLPTGQAQPPLPHLPLQHHLPGVYAVGVHGLAVDAQPQERAQAQQLQGYIALLDQLLAHGSAQEAFVRRLFHVPAVVAPAPGSPRAAPGAGGAAPSYAWQVLGDAQVPGLGALLALPPALLQARHCEPFDDAAARRSRMLDLLLALHGQAWPQHSLRQFMDHLTEPEREAELLALKEAFTHEVGLHCRHRAAGWDWTRPAGDDASGLQRRVMLLLGLGVSSWVAPPAAPAGALSAVIPPPPPRAPPPALSAGLRGRVLVEGTASGAEAEGDAGAAPGARISVRPAPWFALDLGCSAARRAAGREAAKRLQGVPLARQPRLPGPLLRCATRHDRWGVVPQADGSLALLLGPDEDGRYWELLAPADTGNGEGSGAGGDPGAGRTSGAVPAPGPATGPAAGQSAWQAALARAAALRRFALALDGGCEGLHVVEHVLLRPLGTAAAHPDVPAAFHQWQISAVLPAWTQRGRRPAFRHLAEETLAMNCPAHLQVHTLWLSPSEMGAFEALLQAWQAARRQFHALQCATPAQASAAPLEALDRHAGALARWLLAHGAATAPAEPEEDHPPWHDDDAEHPADDQDDPATDGRGLNPMSGPATMAAVAATPAG